MRLSLRVQKRFLWLASGLCLVTAPAVILWGLEPLDSSIQQQAWNMRAVSGVSEGGPKVIANTDQADNHPKAWSKHLRRPLYDPPPPPPPEIPPPPPLRVTLLGTIVEPGNSMAIMSSPEGIVEYKRPGDLVGPAESPAELVEVHDNSVIVRRGDETLTLRRTE